MTQRFGISVNLDSLDDLIDQKAEAVEAATRPAAQAAAQVLYDEVKRNVNALGRKTGNLSAAVYQAFSQSNSGEGRAVYHVSWNPRRAPHGHLVEFGYVQKYRVVLSKKTGKWITLKDQKLANPIQQPAHPFVRPAMSKFDEALQAARKEMLEQIDGSVR